MIANLVCIFMRNSSLLMPLRETVAVYCENHIKHINTLCGKNAEFSSVKSGGTYSNHWSFKGPNNCCFILLVRQRFHKGPRYEDVWGGEEIQIHVFSTAAFDCSEWLVPNPGRFTPEEKAPGTYCIERHAGLRVGMGDLQKRKYLLGIEPRPSSPLACCCTD
jgi:hypothetical protein